MSMAKIRAELREELRAHAAMDAAWKRMQRALVRAVRDLEAAEARLASAADRIMDAACLTVPDETSQALARARDLVGTIKASVAEAAR